MSVHICVGKNMEKKRQCLRKLNLKLKHNIENLFWFFWFFRGRNKFFTLTYIKSGFPNIHFYEFLE